MTMNATPLPLQDPIARPRRPEFGDGRPDPLEGMITDPWQQFLTAVTTTVSTQPARIKQVAVTAQGASIGATDLGGGKLSTGLYRVTYYARITQAAGVSSSLTVTIGWSENGVSCSLSGVAMTGNSTTTVQSGTVMVLADATTPLTYSTTYVSVGAPPMKYTLQVVLETISA